jgi:hypothetical protein
MGTVPTTPFEDLARELSSRPDLVARLLADHPAGTHVGICPGCTTRGGRMVIDAPCPIRKLALMAAQMRKAAARTATT